MKKAVYPGSFDPITNGHIDIVKRSLKVFDELIIGVARNIRKKGLFTFDERVSLIKEIFKDDPRIKVEAFDGLLVEFAKKHNVTAIIRGLRAVSDFEYEFQMAIMNKKLYPEIETFFMMTGEEYFYLSSNLVKEVIMFGGCIDGLVPDIVREKLIEKLRSGGKNGGV